MRLIAWLYPNPSSIDAYPPPLLALLLAVAAALYIWLERRGRRAWTRVTLPGRVAGDGVYREAVVIPGHASCAPRVVRGGALLGLFASVAAVPCCLLAWDRYGVALGLLAPAIGGSAIATLAGRPPPKGWFLIVAATAAVFALWITFAVGAFDGLRVETHGFKGWTEVTTLRAFLQEGLFVFAGDHSAEEWRILARWFGIFAPTSAAWALVYVATPRDAGGRSFQSCG